MDPKLIRIIDSLKSFEDLRQFEANAQRQSALDQEVEAALAARASILGRSVVAQVTGIDLSKLSPAEEKIVQAAATYAGLKKRQGTNANRMFDQIRRVGLLEAAERSVMKSQPTMGFETLESENLGELSYERIIVDHPDEFSDRALWYAQKRLGLATATKNAPVAAITPVQRRTETLLNWLEQQSVANDGFMPAYTNAEAAAAVGMEDIHRHGRVQGNIQSRLDFACYRANLPALGLTAIEPFHDAWQDRQGRDWDFPVELMQHAAQNHQWTHQDFERIADETRQLPGQAHLVWKNEFSTHEKQVRAWAFAETFGSTAVSASITEQRNPPWSREELILALDLYLRSRRSPFGKDSEEVKKLSELLGRMARTLGRTQDDTFRNPAGVYMKMMNFRRWDPDYVSGGKVGLERGNKQEEPLWYEFADDPSALASAVANIHARYASAAPPYWVFVCNPKKWAIDAFLEKGVTRDTWGVRPADRDRFAPGQLGIVRVGVDRRSAEQREGKPPLESGIYALCEVESEAYNGTGANDEFWADGVGRAPGWPTVRIRYLRTYLDAPLTIKALKERAPELSPLLLDGFQAASFPISDKDYHRVIELLDEDMDELVAQSIEREAAGSNPGALEDKYKNASPEVKERVSKYIERGNVGSRVKKALGHRCQVCAALGREPIAFKKPNGEPYAEAHHVMPVAELRIGSLAASNIMVLCANHHRQMHYGGIEVAICEKTFEFKMDGTAVAIDRYLDDGA